VKTKFPSSVRTTRWLLVAILVLVTVSMALGACGGGSSDQAFVTKFMAMWDSNDVTAAKQLFADSAKIYWPEGTNPPVVGIDAISSTVASYPVDPIPAGDVAFTYVPSATDMKKLSAGYTNTHYIACPVMTGSQLYMMVLEIKDGKVLTQWVSYMYNY
jgi:hypothetical protein